jgi:hypothetical protein
VALAQLVDRLPDRGAPVLTGAHRETLAVIPPLDELFPYGGLVRGSVVAVDSPALSLALVAATSAAGAWCGAVGLPSLGLAAAAEMGVDLRRFIVVPTPGEQWAVAIAALLDGLEVVLVSLPKQARASDARRLAVRVRERRGVLVAVGGWPESVDLRLRLDRSEWAGLDHGYGRLTGRQCRITSSGRGAAARERQVTAWLPPAR